MTTKFSSQHPPNVTSGSHSIREYSKSGKHGVQFCCTLMRVTKATKQFRSRIGSGPNIVISKAPDQQLTLEQLHLLVHEHLVDLREVLESRRAVGHGTRPRHPLHLPRRPGAVCLSRLSHVLHRLPWKSKNKISCAGNVFTRPSTNATVLTVPQIQQQYSYSKRH